jgi:hypothetical protein
LADFSCDESKPDYVQRVGTERRKEQEMRFKADNGFVITDDLVEKWAARYESGNYPGTGAEIVVGRPRLAQERTLSVNFRLPESKLIALETLASKNGCNRSQVLRDAVDDYLSSVL